MKAARKFALGFMLVALAAGGIGCLFRAQPQLVLRTDPATVTRKMQELATERGARQQAASSYVLGQPVGNSRFVIYGLSMSERERYQTIVAATEVEVVPYGKGLTQLRARTLHPIVSSLPASNAARESQALRVCADYIERGVRPAQLQVRPWDEFERRLLPGGPIRTNEMGDYNLRELRELMRLHDLRRQTGTNQFGPPAQTPDWVKPELRLK